MNPIIGSKWYMEKRLENSISGIKWNCFHYEPGLLESIYIGIRTYENIVAPENKTEEFNKLQLVSNNQKHKTTSWVNASSGFDYLSSNSNHQSRALSILQKSNWNSVCSAAIEKLNEKPWVALIHQAGQRPETCDEDCTAYLIFPNIKVIAVASYD